MIDARRIYEDWRQCKRRLVAAVPALPRTYLQALQLDVAHALEDIDQELESRGMEASDTSTSEEGDKTSI